MNLDKKILPQYVLLHYYGPLHCSGSDSTGKVVAIGREAGLGTAASGSAGRLLSAIGPWQITVLPHFLSTDRLKYH
jgi:hypothetical protein